MMYPSTHNGRRAPSYTVLIAGASYRMLLYYGVFANSRVRSTERSLAVHLILNVGVKGRGRENQSGYSRSRVVRLVTDNS